jgi:hypothetical protein
MRMFRLSLVVLFAAALSAQDPSELPKPPADVDQALRARIA